ncbi:MAG: hypothetical protein ACYTFQ_06475 [Planctomycetota bacterium]
MKPPRKVREKKRYFEINGPPPIAGRESFSGGLIEKDTSIQQAGGDQYQSEYKKPPTAEGGRLEKNFVGCSILPV